MLDLGALYQMRNSERGMRNGQFSNFRRVMNRVYTLKLTNWY
jgi:hypothetical protein